MTRGATRRRPARTSRAGGTRPATTAAARPRRTAALVLVVINLAVASAPTDVACEAASLVSEALVPHYVLGAQGLAVTARVPDDFGVLDLFEVLVPAPGTRGVADLFYAWTLGGRELTFAGVPVDNANPVRVIVLARDAAVRAAVDAALNP